MLGNRRPLYELLFQAAWRALRERVPVECGMDAAATMVLHTGTSDWNITHMFMRWFQAAVRHLMVGAG